MAQIIFTPNLQRHVACPPRAVSGATVAEALRGVFADNPRLAGYVLDERGALRRHMVIFVDGRPLADRDHLSDPLPEDGEIFVMQALTGG
ncbi:MAG: MoaD/ThiS family protein [Gammaproteobacteria bacterium]|nr:MoaD/ThiS family protein [Gammaproteobacteria bacterium]